MQQPKPVTDITLILQKMEHYCAYQERSEQEVRTKLSTFKITETNKKQIIAELKLLGFIDEARFARAFTLGKFRINKWGKNKIRFALKQKGVSDKIIEKSLNEIDDAAYTQTMEKLVRTKIRSVRDEDDFKTMSKLVAHLVNKGYETSLAWDCVREIIDGTTSQV
jgi:regulatory protein